MKFGEVPGKIIDIEADEKLFAATAVFDTDGGGSVSASCSGGNAAEVASRIEIPSPAVLEHAGASADQHTRVPTDGNDRECVKDANQIMETCFDEDRNSEVFR